VRIDWEKLEISQRPRWPSVRIPSARFLRLDLAEKNIYEALRSDDPRRRDAASMFTIRNRHRARKRGWITSSTSVAELSINASAPARMLTFRWRTSEDDERDAERAEAERLRDEVKTVVAIGWGTDMTTPSLRNRGATPMYGLRPRQ
jgi:hypothetical protein